jgi:small subunit ribosomal protein S8
MFTDPIADYLTRVRNAQMAGLKVVDIPSSNMKKAITEILHDKGYILNYKFEETNNNQGNIKLALKYNQSNNQPAIKKLIRVSKPGLRKYSNAQTLPRVINGLGIAILSTSKGVITDKEARDLNVGGEIVCYIY